MTRALGIDLSVSRTGLCLLPAGWCANGRLDWSMVLTAVVPGNELPRSAGQDVRAKRLQEVRDAILDRTDHWDAAVAGFEQYAFRARGFGAHDIAEVGGAVKVALHHRGIQLHSFAQSTVRKTLLGKLPRRGAKQWVQAHCRDIGAPFWQDPDVCDAFAVANHLLSVLGFRFVGMTP